MSDDFEQDDLFKPPSRVERRLIRSAVEIEADGPETILYQHTVFCQTGMPYRNPGPGIREWERSQGAASLMIEAGKALDPESGKWLQLGIPYGPKPRLILSHLNREAIISGSPEIEVQDSLTAFVRRIAKYSPNGQEIRKFKEQLGNLSASTVRLAITEGGRPVQVNGQVIAAFDLWFAKDERQRVLWPSIIRLSADYFNSLQKHAVPLDERAIGALSHNAMALDIYAWLAQRLHRVEPRHPAFIPWTALKAQFGWHYGRIRKFKEVFRQTLDMVLTQYRGARIELDDRGMTLRNSPPPVKGRIWTLPKA